LLKRLYHPTARGVYRAGRWAPRAGHRCGVPAGAYRPAGIGRRLSAKGSFWYAGRVKSSVSIVLFFLLSGFFLSALLGAVEHSRKLLAVAGGCLVAVVCVIVFLTPVQLPPSLRLRFGDEESGPTSVSGTTVATVSPVTTSVTATVLSPDGILPATSASVSPVTSVFTTETFDVQ